MEKSEEKSLNIVERLLNKYTLLRSRQDSALILTYLFEQGHLNPDIKDIDDILDLAPKLSNLYGLCRSRAHLQNKLGRCLATGEVREKRDELEDIYNEIYSDE